MKRSPFIRRKPIRRGKGKTKYARRDRAPSSWFLWVKSLPCWLYATDDSHRCEGEIEADHAGRRGIKQKALDRTCIPLCTKAHAERDAFSGPFKHWRQARMREWLRIGIEHTHKLAARAGIEIPSC